MPIVKKLSFLFLITALIGLAACHRSHFPQQKPHEDTQDGGQPQVESQARSSSPVDFSIYENEKDINKLADGLLKMQYLVDKDYGSDDSFRRSFYHFQNRLIESLADGNTHPKIIKKYKDFFTNHCFDNERISCDYLKTLRSYKNTYRIALYILKTEKETLSNNQFYNIYQSLLFLRARGLANYSVIDFTFSNLSKIREVYKSSGDRNEILLDRILSQLSTELIGMGHQEKVFHLLDKFQPIRFDDRISGFRQKDKLRMLDIWAQYYSQSNKSPLSKMKETLEKDRSSLFYKAKRLNSEDQFILKQVPKISICSFLLDRVYVGAWDPVLAESFYSYFKGSENCFNETRNYLAAQLMLNARSFFDDLKEIISDFKDGGVANADKLNNLRNKLPFYAEQWREYNSQADELIDFANSTFSNFNPEVVSRYVHLRKSLLRNILIYVQFPMNMAFLSALEKYKTLNLSFSGVKSDNIIKLIKKLLYHGDYYLDLGLIPINQRQLKHPEMLISFDFASRLGIFQRVGVQPEDILDAVAKNYFAEELNIIKEDTQDRKSRQAGSSYRQIKETCYQVSQWVQGHIDKVSPPAYRPLTNIGSGIFYDPDKVHGIYLTSLRGKINDRIRELESRFLYPYRIVSEFKQILNKNGLLKDSTSIDKSIKSRHQAAYSFIKWVKKDLNKVSECNHVFVQENWRIYLEAFRLERKFIDMIYDQMKLARDNPSANIYDLNKSARIFIEGTPADKTIMFDRNSLKFYTAAFKTRLANYVMHGAFGTPAIAPYVQVDMNFNKFTQKQLNEHVKFPFNENKQAFLDEVIEYLSLSSGGGGIWSARFIDSVYNKYDAIVDTRVSLYSMSPSVFGKDYRSTYKELTVAAMRHWHTSIIESSEDPINQERILKSRQLNEKFARLGESDDNILKTRFFKERQTLAPLKYVVDDLVLDHGVNEINYETSEDGSAPANPPRFFDALIKYFTDRNSMAATLVDLDQNILERSDEYHKRVIEEKIEHLYAFLCRAYKQPNEAFDWLKLDPALINAPRSLDYDNYAGSTLVDTEEFGLLNSYIYKFRQAIPEEYRDYISDFSQQKTCSEFSND